MLYLYKSNRLDSLLDQLTELTRDGQSGPFDFDLMCAPDGIHDRMKMALAKAHGIFCGEIVSPRNGAEQIISSVIPREDHRLPHSSDGVLFFICRFILTQLDSPDFAPVRRYLGTPYTMHKLLSLAGVLSGLFGEYTVYRPQTLLEWQKAAPGWQESIMAQVAAAFAANVGEGAIQAITRLRSTDVTASLPRRVIMFGVSTLPPIFLQLLAAISESTDVHLFVVTPSLDYFESTRRQHPEPGEPATQNPLLSLLGVQPSQFQDALVSISNQVAVVEHDIFDTALPRSVLGQVQRGLLLNDPFVPLSDAPPDTSVQFHQCTGIDREVDAVVACILRQMMDNGVAPTDVVVMAPDINAYAPYIEAAMMHTGVPYTISDRSMCASPGAPEAIDALLQLASARLTLQEVFSLLEMAPVKKRFALDASDVGKVWKWCRDARIRACIDGRHRRQHGLEPFEENTWRFGLKRLLLGIAIEDEADLFGGVSPIPAYTGTETTILGNAIAFLEALFSLVEACQTPRSVADWCALWESQLTVFLPATADDFAAVRSVFQHLADHAQTAAFDTEVDFAAFQSMLKGRVARAAFTSGNGPGVRFSSFRFLRGESIPVIALLGMNEGQFPGDSHSPSFDLIAAQPVNGDRDLRFEGYHMFLESVMAASTQLLVFYGGARESSGHPVKPCVPVRELRDAMNTLIVPSGQKADEAPVQLYHPVHPHDPAYFSATSPEYVSYNRADFQAALAQRQQAMGRDGYTAKADVGVRFDEDMFGRSNEIPKEGVTLSLGDFFRFWKNPALFYLSHSLGLAFIAPRESAPDDEPLQLERLDEWLVGQRFIDMILNRKNWPEILPLLRSLGIAPTGNLGEFYASRVYERAARISSAVANEHITDKKSECDVDITIDSTMGPLRLKGPLQLYNDSVFEYSYSRVKNDTRLKLMLQYLIARTTREMAQSGPQDSAATLIGRETTGPQTVRCEYKMDLADIPATLSQISAWTIMGLSRPLAFSVEDAFQFAKRAKSLAPTQRDALLRKTLQALTQGLQQVSPPEARALLDTGVIQRGEAEFLQMTTQVVAPVIEHMSEQKL
ncbi:MAG: exodeoxyribonuclease V subunit gamma [Deltaproteobacteria bacterium]|nr:exodeoxyribonuclease V subunit gamma [Deltaproteobacteria bacterium]